MIEESDGVTYTEDAVSCDGTDSTIVSNTQCSIPISTLTQAPYSLSIGDYVSAKLIAINIKGDSVESSAGSGAFIITVPNAPINLAENTAQRTVSDLGITWQAAANNGGSVVIDYRVNIAE